MQAIGAAPMLTARRVKTPVTPCSLAPAGRIPPRSVDVMRILVAIANHGTKNQKYVQHLIDTYRSFTMDVRIVVLSNVAKDFGPDVEVKVGTPIKNPWSLPFGHRPLFVERQDEHDLFIYSEDDTEITEAHVRAFCEATQHLPDDRIAGFIRYEDGPDGTRYYSTVHGTFHWDPNSILAVNDRVYARYTNDHSACYILTREQLKRCIASGGFDVPPHAGRYDMLCSAATDPYTRCGFTKVICISHMAEFSLHHLPDIYLGRIGIEADEIDAQIARMLDLARSDGSRGPLIPPETGFCSADFDKKYFEPLRQEVLDLVPGKGTRILSIGCERGLTEGALVEAGHDVTGIPLDPVIAVSAEMRGIKTTSPDIDLALQELDGEHFDCLLFNNVLSHVADPSALVKMILPFLSNGGSVVISYDNSRNLTVLRRRIRRQGFGAIVSQPDRPAGGTYHPPHVSQVRRWMRAAGLRPVRNVFLVPERHRNRSARALGLADRWLADAGAMIGLRQ